MTRVRDAGSLNGTYVNRARIDEAVAGQWRRGAGRQVQARLPAGGGRVSSRSYLSIGDVLTLLRQEFPDVTISKIRFLESQGLVNPERTPSGYRKFYEHDVERLRWVLRQQREHFLPLKVIKDRLDEDNGVAGRRRRRGRPARRRRRRRHAGVDRRAGTSAPTDRTPPAVATPDASGGSGTIGCTARTPPTPAAPRWNRGAVGALARRSGAPPGGGARSGAAGRRTPAWSPPPATGPRPGRRSVPVPPPASGSPSPRDGPIARPPPPPARSRWPTPAATGRRSGRSRWRRRPGRPSPPSRPRRLPPRPPRRRRRDRRPPAGVGPPRTVARPCPWAHRGVPRCPWRTCARRVG